MTGEVMEAIGWWHDWQRYRVLPFGSLSLGDEPAIVFDVIDLCERVHEEALAEVRRA